MKQLIHSIIIALTFTISSCGNSEPQSDKWVLINPADSSNIQNNSVILDTTDRITHASIYKSISDFNINFNKLISKKNKNSTIGQYDFTITDTGKYSRTAYIEGDYSFDDHTSVKVLLNSDSSIHILKLEFTNYDGSKTNYQNAQLIVSSILSVFEPTLKDSTISNRVNTLTGHTDESYALITSNTLIYTSLKGNVHGFRIEVYYNPPDTN